MSRLTDIIHEDREMLDNGTIKDWKQVVSLKLAQISSTLAMIYDLEYERKIAEISDDGR